MSQKKYWQSFGEISNRENLQKNEDNEFREELPFEDVKEGLMDAKVSAQGFF
jgi:molybdopterin-containing oxidoreductase family iron-sulfur binding subunit